MHTKKAFSIGFAVLLLLSMAAVTMPVSADTHAPQAMWVDPGSWTTAPELNTLKKGDPITVDIWVNITDPDGAGPATGMYGWSYELEWEVANINITSFTRHTPAPWGGNTYIPPGAGRVKVRPDPRYLYFDEAIIATAPATGWAGAMSIATFTFVIQETVYMPDAAKIGTLDLKNTKIPDDVGNPIVHTAYDGYYRKCPQPIPTPKLGIRPASVKGVPDGTLDLYDKFNWTIVVENLAKGWNLWGWEAKLKYCNECLEAQASFEGPFLDSFVNYTPPNSPTNRTTYINILDYSPDTVLTAGAFNDPNHTRPECIGGVGVLAKIEFNITCKTVAPDIRTCSLKLYDTKLVGVYPNNTVYPIPQLAPNNATFQCPYEIVGWALDCQTQPWRKKGLTTGFNPTDYYGKGINATADSFEPQDFVILSAYLEYNKQPECGKIVMFEIYGPPNSFLNISIIRTAITNCSGVATINFTIPHHAGVFGHWVCYQAAQVKDPRKPPYYAKPDDWLRFKVGWIIEILDVTVEYPVQYVPPGVKKCESIIVTVTYKTIAFMPCKVLFTAIALDELWDPIQEETWWEIVDPVTTPGVLCSERNDTTVEYSHIPCFAHAGFATVYVNAFTDFPMLCGCPYCPEKSVKFMILASVCPP